MEEKKTIGKKLWMAIGAGLAVVAAIIIGMVMYQNAPAQQIPKLLDLGQKYLLDEDYEQAIAKFDEVLAIDPKNINAYMGKAEAYIGLEDYASSTDMYEEVITIDPSYEDAYLKAADVHITTVDYSNALDVLSRGYDTTQSVTIQAKMEEVEALIAEQEEVEETVDAETEDVEEEESEEESETAEETENDAGEENIEENEHSDVADQVSESKAEEKKAETQQEEVAVVANTQTNEAATSSDYATAEVKNNRQIILNYITDPNGYYIDGEGNHISKLVPEHVVFSGVSNGVWSVGCAPNDAGYAENESALIISEVYENHDGNMKFMGYRFVFPFFEAGHNTSEELYGVKYFSLAEVLDYPFNTP